MSSESTSPVKHHCGLFGVWGHPDAAELTCLGLHAQQHRGQESAGICTTDGKLIVRHAGMGLVNDVFANKRIVEQLRNPVAIGHVRYSTTGSSHQLNTQPLLVTYAGGQVAVAHNGNLINAGLLRNEYEEHGAIFSTTSDTEVIVHLMAKPTHRARPNALAHVLSHLQGAFSLVFLFPDRLVAARDPFGVRPLCIGRMDNGAHVVASETSAFDIIDATYVRDVVPGEMVTFDEAGLHSHFFVERGSVTPGQCIFEHVYFADPASYVFGQNVHLVRKAMGRQLAREAPVDADLIVPVPNCARCAAGGYSEASGIPAGRAYTVSHYTGRSFIMPDQKARDLTVKMKLNVIKETVSGKRLVVVEDSVVRGTTTRGKIGALRKAGAREIHLRVASPPIRHPCYYGIDFPDRHELIAHERSVSQIRDYLQVDSLHYLSLEGMLRCVEHDGTHACHACFSGRYPIPVHHQTSKYMLERYQLRMFDD